MLISAILNSFATNFRSFVKRKKIYRDIICQLGLVRIEKNFVLGLETALGHKPFIDTDLPSENLQLFLFHQVNFLRPVYTGDICRAVTTNSKSRVSTSCDFSAILMRFIAPISQELRTCSILRRFPITKLTTMNHKGPLGRSCCHARVE